MRAHGPAQVCGRGLTRKTCRLQAPEVAPVHFDLRDHVGVALQPCIARKEMAPGAPRRFLAVERAQLDKVRAGAARRLGPVGHDRADRHRAGNRAQRDRNRLHHGVRNHRRRRCRGQIDACQCARFERRLCRGQFACGRCGHRLGLGCGLVGRSARKMCQRQRVGPALIVDQRCAYQAGDTATAIFGPGHRGPALHAGIDLVGRNILPGHDPCLVPHARQGIGQRQILPDLGRILALADGVGQHGHTAFVLPGHDQRQAKIGCGQHIAIGVDRVECGRVAAHRQIAQHQPKRGAAAVIAQFDGIGK